MSKITASILIVLITMAYCVADNEYRPTSVLREISGSLESGEIDNVEVLIDQHFLNAITNGVYRGEVLEHTKAWVDKYGDNFPEAILLYAMAGGPMDFLKYEYNKLENLTSKNCIRWCMMIQNIPLEEELVQKHGSYFMSSTADFYKYGSRLVLGDNSIALSKTWGVEKKPLGAALHSVYLGTGYAVKRADGVPVPWGKGMVPDVCNIPHLVSSHLLEQFERWYDTPKMLRYHFDPRTMIVVWSDRIQPSGQNKVWDFFLGMLPPVIFVGRQPVSVDASSTISGDVHVVAHMLLSKESDRESFYAEPNLRQDVVVSAPIGFKVHLEGVRPVVNFTLGTREIGSGD